MIRNLINSITDITGMTGDAVGTTIITIIIFITGYVIKIIYNFVISILQNKKLKKDAIDIINDISIKCLKISNDCLNIKKNYKISNKIIINKIFIPELYTIKEIGYFKLKKSFKTKGKLKSKSFKKLYNGIDVIKNEHDRYLNTIDIFFTNYKTIYENIDHCNYELNKLIIESVNKIINEYQMVNKLDTSKINDVFYKNYIILFNEATTNGPIEDYEAFLSKIKELIKESLNRSFFIDVINIVQSCSIVEEKYEKLRNLEKQFYIDYDSLYLFFRTSGKIFQKIIKILK